ncbi:MAG: PAS domain S-box protein [Opitutales bacterium]|nr:PAS domain S-box protein [Opitutales bacterium]
MNPYFLHRQDETFVRSASELTLPNSLKACFGELGSTKVRWASPDPGRTPELPTDLGEWLPAQAGQWVQAAEEGGLRTMAESPEGLREYLFLRGSGSWCCLSQKSLTDDFYGVEEAWAGLADLPSRTRPNQLYGELFSLLRKLSGLEEWMVLREEGELMETVAAQTEKTPLLSPGERFCIHLLPAKLLQLYRLLPFRYIANYATPSHRVKPVAQGSGADVLAEWCGLPTMGCYPEEHEFLQMEGYSSLLVLPIHDQNQHWGFVIGRGSRPAPLSLGKLCCLGGIARTLSRIICERESHIRERRLFRFEGVMQEWSRLVKDEVSFSKILTKVVAGLGDFLRFSGVLVVDEAKFHGFGEVPGESTRPRLLEFLRTFGQSEIDLGASMQLQQSGGVPGAALLAFRWKESAKEFWLIFFRSGIEVSRVAPSRIKSIFFPEKNDQTSLWSRKSTGCYIFPWDTYDRKVIRKTTEFLQWARMVTTTMREKERVLAKERRLQAVLEAIPSGVFLKDGEGRLQLINQVGLAQVGFQDVSWQGKTDWEMARIFPAYRPFAETCSISDQQCWDKGEAMVFEESFSPEEGGEYVYEVRKIPLFEEDGSRRALISVVTDISTLRAKEALHEMNEKVARISENVPGMIFEYTQGENGSHSFSYLSDGVSRFTGMTPQEIQENPQKFFALVHSEDLEALEKSIRHVVTNRDPHWEFEFRLQHAKTGQMHWLNGSSTRRETPQGDVFWNGYLMDVSERKKAEEALLREGKTEAVEAVVGGIAHDFNNFLTSMRLSAEMIHYGIDEASDLKTLSKTLLVEIGLAIKVSRQLMAFTQNQPIKVEVFDISEVLHRIAAFALRGASTVFSLRTDQSWFVETDRTLIEQILFNLFLNASQAQQKEGVIEVIMEKDNSYGNLLLLIKDRGPGIPLDLQKRIFEPNFTTKENGNGLGLFVCQKLARKIGGTLELVYSESSAGTAFLLMLPAGLLREGETSHQEISDVSGKPDRLGLGTFGDLSFTRKVFFVEDEPAQIEAVETFFQKMDVALETFTKGEALEARLPCLEGNGFGFLFLLDVIVKGGKGGFELAPVLRKRFPEARICLVSGHGEQWKERTAELEALKVAYLPKPYRLRQLRDLLVSDEG